MEETTVVIVGAGPAGLALATALSNWKIKSIILEKNRDVCEDPRAIALAGDVPRALEFLGINHSKLQEFGQELITVNYHPGAWTTKPFFILNQHHDWLDQVHQPASVLMQPGLERALREQVRASKYAELRLECIVTSILEVIDGVVVSYNRGDGTEGKLKGAYLVGADGKRGFVRKEYLEAKGIEQIPGLIHYDAEWIAANLHVTLPTPTSHPGFPLWSLGYKPEELWDLFWPEGFHFCNHPTMPVATGRFGPANDRYWRFEYELPAGFRPDDFEQHLEEQMRPHLTLQRERLRRNGKTPPNPVQFPWDCVNVIRCAPAHFVHKIANQWFHNRIILIGDAAHVFPPFGAQGMASGIRDAVSLSWRLALLCNRTVPAELSLRAHDLLNAWSRERREGVDQSMRETTLMGRFLLNKSPLVAALASLVSRILEYVPSLRDAFFRWLFTDAIGISGVDHGYFLPNYRGGLKVAQIYVKSSDGQLQLSDHLFWRSKAVLTLLVLHSPSKQEAVAIDETLTSVNLPSYLLASEAMELCDDTTLLSPLSSLSVARFAPASLEDVAKAGLPSLPGYDLASFRRRFQHETKFALVRSDLIVFSEAQTLGELCEHLNKSRELLAAQ